MFQRLAKAEAAIHGVPIDQVHFHEIGAVDSLVDVVGFVSAMERLGIEAVYCSPLPWVAAQSRLSMASCRFLLRQLWPSWPKPALPRSPVRGTENWLHPLARRC